MFIRRRFQRSQQNPFKRFFQSRRCSFPHPHHVRQAAAPCSHAGHSREATGWLAQSCCEGSFAWRVARASQARQRGAGPDSATSEPDPAADRRIVPQPGFCGFGPRRRQSAFGSSGSSACRQHIRPTVSHMDRAVHAGRCADLLDHLHPDIRFVVVPVAALIALLAFGSRNTEKGALCQTAQDHRGSGRTASTV